MNGVPWPVSPPSLFFFFFFLHPSLPPVWNPQYRESRMFSNCASLCRCNRQCIFKSLNCKVYLQIAESQKRKIAESQVYLFFNIKVYLSRSVASFGQGQGSRQRSAAPVRVGVAGFHLRAQVVCVVFPVVLGWLLAPLLFHLISFLFSNPCVFFSSFSSLLFSLSLRAPGTTLRAISTIVYTHTHTH
jgi:hypothetical protein